MNQAQPIAANGATLALLDLTRRRRLRYRFALRLRLRRYFLWSSAVGIGSLGLAIAVSLLAVAYGSTSALRFTEVASAIGAEVSYAFSESLTSRHEPPPPPPPSPASPPALTSQPASLLSLMKAPPNNVYIRSGRISNVNITFYDCANQGFCGAMYNGRKVYEGAAACSWNLAIGTKFVIVGDPTRRVYICEDRGLLANTWVDIFFYYPSDGYRWQGLVGRYGTIEIVD
jgi:hypothetical protein